MRLAGPSVRQARFVFLPRRRMHGFARKNSSTKADFGERRTSSGAVLLDLAGVHHADEIRYRESLFLIVGDEIVVMPIFSCKRAQPDAQFLAHFGIERAERFVQQQHARLDGERARQCHALTLPAGQLARIALAQTFELHQFQQIPPTRRAISLREGRGGAGER